MELIKSAGRKGWGYLGLGDRFVSHQWHFFDAPSDVISMDGDTIAGAIMRRRAMGGIQYRAMTEAEETIFDDASRFT